MTLYCAFTIRWRERTHSASSQVGLLAGVDGGLLKVQHAPASASNSKPIETSSPDPIFGPRLGLAGTAARAFKAACVRHLKLTAFADNG
jgi:hypothetical protein